MKCPIQRANGFTLVELVVTVAIAAILLALAIPSLQALMERNKMAACVNAFIAHLHLAHGEAIKQTKRVVLCPSGDGES